jgi:hypothetical protein
MAERESDQAERDRKDAEIAEENRQRQIRQGVIKEDKPKPKSKAKKEEPKEAESEA